MFEMFEFLVNNAFFQSLLRISRRPSSPIIVHDPRGAWKLQRRLPSPAGRLSAEMNHVLALFLCHANSPNLCHGIIPSIPPPAACYPSIFTIHTEKCSNGQNHHHAS